MDGVAAMPDGGWARHVEIRADGTMRSYHSLARRSSEVTRLLNLPPPILGPDLRVDLGVVGA
jgi:hypothetical protein